MKALNAKVAGHYDCRYWYAQNERLLFRKFAAIKKRKGFSVLVLVCKNSEQYEKNLYRYKEYPRTGTVIYRFRADLFGHYRINENRKPAC